MDTVEKPALSKGKRLAFALGMPLALLLVFVLAAPLLLAGAAARAVEDAFAAQHLGRLELGDVDLSWTQPQSVSGGRLLDPEGDTVASFSVDLPSLLDLARRGGRKLGRVRAELTADLIADDAGTTNLQRALTPRDRATTAGAGAGTGDREPRDESAPGELLSELELDLELILRRLSWSDPETRALGQEVALRDVQLRGSLTPGQPLELDLKGRVSARTDGALKLHATLTELAGPAPSLVLECDVRSFPTGLVDGLAGLGGELQGLLGPSLDLHASGRGTAAGGAFELRLESAAARVELATLLDDGRLGITGDVSLDLPAARLDEWIAPSLPASLRVERVSSDAFAAGLELGVAEFGAWLADTAAPFPAAELAVRDLQLGDWRVASTQAGGAEHTWTGLRAAAELDAQRSGSITLSSADADPLELALQFGPAADGPDLESSGFEPHGADLHVPGVPTALLDQLAGLDGQLVRLIGTHLDLHAALPESPPESAGPPTRGSLNLSSPQLDLVLNASYADGLLVLAPEGEAPALRYRAPERLLSEFAPELDSAQLLGDLSLELESLELPLGPWLAGDLTPAELVRGARTKLAVRLGALEFTHVLSDGSPMPVTLEPLVLDLQLADAAARVDLAGGLQDSDGVLSVQLAAADLTGLLAEPALLPVVFATAKATEVPTLMVDLLAEQDGLLMEMLGPQLSLRAEGQWPARGHPFEIELTSPEANLEFEGTPEDGVIRAGEDQQLTATAPLGPLFSSRVVGQLVPLLIGIAKASDADPVLMRVEHFNFPLDGDLAQLDCDVHLELGEVSYQLLPGLQGTIEKGTGGSSKRRTSIIAPLDIQVRAGVVTYDSTPLKIDGVEVLVGGTFDLLSGTLKMTTLVPLKNLGRGVARELEKARDFLDPALGVPIEIGGTIARPTIGLGKSFLDTILPGTLRGAIGGGLRGLLGRDKEKEAEEQRKKDEKKARKKARREAEEAAREEAEEPGS